ncbi:MAG TPA: MBL fold metallo-hydrolase [Tepidisphaeraceae bacterium]|nr:MBL fold metallo-hydrolase [Tepidisphaeraceae bacterium]
MSSSIRDYAFGMRIQFCGADRTVTGSSHLLEINGLRVFLDMGLFQGPRDTARELNSALPADVKSADAIILSHGHLDHCGKLPVALRHGFSGPIYCTPATAEVARIVLEDSARIQQEDVQFLNQRARPPGDSAPAPLYGPNDIPAVLRQFKRIAYGQKTDLGNGIAFTFYDAGHILGSAYVVLEWTEMGKPRKLLFTADVGRYDAPVLRDPAPLPGAMDLVITESTYGNAVHGPMSEVGPQFLDAVKATIARHGRLIVPSFAVGRTQTMLWYLEKFIQEKQMPQIPIFVDSPMGVEVSRVHTQFPDNYDEQTRAMIGTHDLFGLARITFASSTQDSKQINRTPGPCVIIASSPTCEFGRVLHHLERSVENPNDMVLFCGWIPPQTLGRRIQQREPRVRIYDRWYDLKCEVRTIHGLSAHADGDELLRFLKPTLLAESQAFVVHGEVPQAEAFAARLVHGGIGQATVPAMETSAVFFSADAPTPPAGGPGATDQD